MSEPVSIKKNLAFQTANQILDTCIPLITAPYLSRVLGVSKLGVYSFTLSIVSYFMLFAALGRYNYGTRSIAACGDDMEKRSRCFWGIYRLHATTSLVCICGYCAYLVFFCKDNRLIAAIQVIELLSCIVNIAWLFTGMERFQLTVTRSMIIRVVSVVLIILLVKKPEDLWIYALIMTGSVFLSQLILWSFVRGTVRLVRVSWKETLQHLKPSLMLFVPLLAMSVYHMMDKTMLGLISNYEQSGYYYQADKIVNIMLGVVSGFSTVLLPRMSAMISQGRTEQADNLFKVSLEGTVLTGTAVAFGIAAIANEFEPVFFGPGYEECILLTIVLAPVLIIKSFSVTARIQFLVPRHREKDFISSVIAGAVVNLAANWILIPRLGAMGAVIGTLIAELAACIIQFLAVGKMISLRTTLVRSAVYILIGVVMFAAVRCVAALPIQIYAKIVLEVFSGAVIFIGLCFGYWRMTHNDIWKTMFAGYWKKLKR